MRKLVTLFCLMGLAAPSMLAESFTAGGQTYTYTEKTTQRLNSGVVHHRLRFTSPKTLNVQIVEVNLSDPNVRVETTLGTDKMFSSQTLVNRYNALKNAGRKPLVVQNASFWSMSSQSVDAGKYATNTCLGGFVQNGKMMTETNSALDAWVGMRHSVIGFKSDRSGFVGQYKTNIRLMCPNRWGSNENTNILQPTEVNKYCHYGTIAIFNQQYPSTREIKVINSTSGQPGAVMTSSDATFVYLKLKSGQSEAYNTWTEYTIQNISYNCSSGTRGSYDMVVVFAIGQHAAVSALQVGDEMKLKYMWHPQGQTDPASMTAIPGLENLLAGESQPMVNGVVQTPSDYGATTYSRSAYGINQAENKLIMCVIDKSTDATYGTSSGCNTTIMSYIMQHWGAHNIVNCDAGGSAQMVINGKQVGTPSDSRGIVGSIVVFDVGSTNTGGDEQQGSTGSDSPSGGVGAVTPASGSPNPFAYDVTGSFDGTNLTVNYKLNSAAKSVALNISGDGNSGRQIALTGKTKGSHSKTIDVSDLAPGDYSWGIIVEGNPVSAPTQFWSIGFNHPQGLAVVQDTNDPKYGTLLVTEGRPSTKSAHWSYSRGGQGIYLFDPQMNGTPQSGNNYAFRGGLADTNYNTSVGSAGKTGNLPRKIRISKDGRIFFSTQSSFAAPLYEVVGGVTGLINTNTFRQVMGGPIWTTSSSPNYYCWTDNSGNFSSAPNVGLAVTGAGTGLRLVLLGGMNSMWSSNTQSATTCNYYNLGANLLWGDKAPSGTVNGINGKYLTNFTNANINCDNRGNIWFSQYRAKPNATEPSIVVVDPNGNELLKDESTVIGGGGLAFNNDFTQVMHSSSATTFSVYDLNWDANGRPVRTEKYRITHGMGANVNDYAWDLAGNLYACGNTNELVKGFAMPRTDNFLETPARADYNFTIDEPDAPDQDDPVVENPNSFVNVTSVGTGVPNPFAYDVSGYNDGEFLVVNYTLNTNCKNARLLLYPGGMQSAPSRAKANASPRQRAVQLGAVETTAGVHKLNVDISSLPDGYYSWAIEVEGVERDQNDIQIFAQHKFNHPQGVETVHDPASPYYGYVLVTEGRASTDAKFHSSTSAEGSGEGIYMFTPTLEGVKNPKTKKYGFTGGLPTHIGPTTSYTSGSGARKIRIADDGRIFLSTYAANLCPIYQINDISTLVDLNPTFDPLFPGSYDASSNAWKHNGQYRCAPGLGMDVKGGGDNLKIIAMGGSGSWYASLAHSQFRVAEYPLGTYAEYDSEPSFVTALDGQYIESPDYANISYDNRGGIWLTQYRETPSNSNSTPAVVYIDRNGNQRYFDTNLRTNAGGSFRLNRDFTQAAMSTGKGVFSIYDVTYADDNTPTLTERYRVTSGMGNGINDFAWDNANNLYAVSNNGELLKAFSVPRVSTSLADADQDLTINTTTAPLYSFSIVGGVLTGVDEVGDGDAATGAKWGAYGTNGRIVITGQADTIEVFNLKGKLVSRGKRDIKVGKGVYIVRCDGSSTKVMVK